MGFFDTEPTSDPRRDRPVQQQAVSGRSGPPEGWVLPTLLPWVRVLGQSDNVRVALVGVRCWPDGLSLDLHVLRRWAPPVPRPGLGFPPRDNDDWAFRFGLRFSDGRIGIAPRRPGGPQPPPAEDAVLLRQQSGGGGQYFRHYTFYLWPLPPIGRLTLVLDWPAERITETHTELDADPIRSAAARAVVVWSDLPKSDGTGPGPGTSGFTSTSAWSMSGGTSVAARRPSANDRES
jgi:hypothetical protein